MITWFRKLLILGYQDVLTKIKAGILPKQYQEQLEWLEEGVIACSTDLYSLDVIIIEILTGQKGHKAIEDVLESWSVRSEISQGDTQWEEIRVCYETALECKDLNPMKRPASARDIIARLHKMESIQTADAAASSTSGVVAPTESKGKRKDELHLHPLEGPAAAGPAGPYHDGEEAFAAGLSDSHEPAAEYKVNSKDEPRPFSSVSASSEDATLHAMRLPNPPPGQTVVMARGSSAYSWLVETKPRLPARLGQRAAIAATKIASTYDMVEPMSYLYVSVVKARELPTMDITGALDPYVEVKLGNFKGVTRHLEKNHNPVWRQTFAFSGAHFQASQIEVIVMDKDTLRDDFVSRVVFDLSDIPSSLPPDSPLAP